MSLILPNSSVALIIHSGWETVYMISEKIPKPQIGKKLGDLSFPWESQEPEETDEQALHRLLQEEVDQHGDLRISEPRILCALSVHGVATRCYVACYRGGSQDTWGTHAGIEYDPLGFQSLEILRGTKPRRDGIDPMFQSFLAEKERRAERGPRAGY
ncbi:MAG: hypothetical protein AAB519_01040 [Patescibacteria group bacterium]